MRVLAVNAGSTTLKLRLLAADDEVEASLDLDPWDGSVDGGPLAEWLGGLGGVDAVGHRVVHGGDRFSEPVRIDADVLDAIAGLTSLAPLHQPRGLAGIDAVGSSLGGVPAVACFDTAFHATIPEPAATYALPGDWRRRWPIRRYGFHGLSHAWASRRAAEMAGRPVEELCTVSCHLGGGASLCAVLGGHSVDTTMGFSPMDGLVMATRPGSVDPGLVLWLLQQGGLAVEEVAQGLEHRAGLAGLAGGSGDMRDVMASADRGDPDASLALAVYGHRLRREIAAMVSALGGLDVLVFTGGIGEHQPRVRADAADGLGFLGVAVDPAANAVATGDGDITAPGCPVRTLVIASREDLEMARQVRELLEAPQRARRGMI